MESVGDPDICVGGFSLWVDGYQFPDESEYFDANWVHVRARCIGQGATVELEGPYVHLTELVEWLDACVRLQAGDSSEARLPTMEPYVQVHVDRSGDSNGLVATVVISPDNLTQFHEFRYSIDASYIEILIGSLRRVLSRVPVRGTKQ